MTQFQQRLAGMAFIGAPLLMLLSDGLRALTGEAYFWPASLLFWGSFWAYCGVIFAMVALSGNTRTATLGGVLALCGTLIGITIIGLDRMAWSLDTHGVTAGIIGEAMGEPRVFFSSRAPGLFFPIGLLILSATLKKSGVLSLIQTAGLLLGIGLFPVGRISGMLPFNVAGDALMLLILAPLGFRLFTKGTYPGLPE